MTFVLDASVALSWAFADEGGGVSTHALERLHDDEAFVPALWGLEVANGLLTAERRSRITAAEAADFCRLLLSLPVAVDPAERRRSFDVLAPLARARDLTSYDSAYLELAARLAAPLATLDGKLQDAARDAGIALAE